MNALQGDATNELVYLEHLMIEFDMERTREIPAMMRDVHRKLLESNHENIRLSLEKRHMEELLVESVMSMHLDSNEGKKQICDTMSTSEGHCSTSTTSLLASSIKKSNALMIAFIRGVHHRQHSHVALCVCVKTAPNDGSSTLAKIRNNATRHAASQRMRHHIRRRI